MEHTKIKKNISYELRMFLKKSISDCTEWGEIQLETSKENYTS